MEVNMRRFLFLFTLLAALCLCAGAPAETEIDSGVCGPSAVWTLSRSGVLTISGTGPMTDYLMSQAPWYTIYLRDSVKRLVVEDGITALGSYAFFGLRTWTARPFRPA